MLRPMMILTLTAAALLATALTPAASAAEMCDPPRLEDDGTVPRTYNEARDGFQTTCENARAYVREECDNTLGEALCPN